MDEEKWLRCSDSRQMLKFLHGQASDRKLRLFACACCRALWHKLETKGSHRAVEVAERFADGASTPEELTLAGAAARSARPTGRYHKVRRASYACAYRDAQLAAVWAAQNAAWGKFPYAKQADLLRCLFGNPFRPVSVNPAWLTWNDGTVTKMAQAIYDDRHFQNIPILADALEESGCSEEQFLSHCRGSGPHALGCWTVDLILGKS